MELIKKIQKFLSYWYLRYLMATELYMVEVWEKVAVHALFTVLFGLAWCFNYCIVLSTVARIRGTNNYVELVS